MKWYTEPFDRFIKYFSEVEKVLNISIDGINVLQREPDLLKAVIELQCSEEYRQISEDEQIKIKKVEQEAEYAKQMNESGYPLLYAHSLVSLWGALETLIEDLTVSFLKNEPSKIKKEKVNNLAIPFFQFVELDEDEQMKLILELLEQKLKSKYRPGIARFEAILDVLNLSGDIPENITRDLYEMYNIRNVIVHRSSVTDRKLLSNCPWLTYQIGEKVIINDIQYQRYSNALKEYAIILMNRVRKHIRGSNSPELKQ